NPVSGTTTSLSALGSDDGGEANLTYTWSSMGPAAVAFSANGTNAAKNAVATFAEAGSYTFTLTIADAAGQTITSSSDVVVNETVTSITLSPTSATVEPNLSQQFSATAFDQFGSPVSPAPSFTWTTDAGSIGNVDASGLYSAPSSIG